MSYLALYRKYRPRVFEEVFGQEHIVRTLQNQVKSGRTSHAYLFTGSRGTGKTSIAKIFARAVNCQHPVEGSACGTCDHCKKIEDSGGMNIIEIDAASHNGVDNIREINEEVKYSPAVGKYKVYIIDEVHMLSTGAFNALLKTLEEPPAHIIFILATTDPQKIPVTILSRCQRFDFKRIPSEAIQQMLKGYMKNESVDIEDDALDYIARLADGGARDALSILEQCISFYFNEPITLDKVLYLVGAVDTHYLFDMVEAISTYNSQKVMTICQEINQQGRSIKQFVTDLVVHARNLLVAKTTQGQGGVLDYSKEYIAKLIHQAESLAIDTLMHYIKAFSQLENDLKGATQPKILLEVGLLRLSEAVFNEEDTAVGEQLRLLQQKLEQLEAKGIQNTQQPSQEKVVEQTKVIKPTRLPEAVPEDVKAIASRYETIKQKLSTGAKLTYGATSAGVIEGDILYIVHGQNMEPGIQKYIDEVKQLINQEAGKQVRVVPIDAHTYQRKASEVHGTHPETSDVTLSINDTLKDIQSKLNYDVKTID